MAIIDTMFGLNRSRSIYESYDEEDREFLEGSFEEDLFHVESLDEGADPFEFISAVIAECDLNMRNMEFAILAEEYEHLRQTGEEMAIYEGTLDNFISRAKEHVQNMWEKIQTFFKDIAKKLDEAIRYDQRILDHYKADAEKASVKYKVSGLLTKGKGSKELQNDIFKQATDAADVFFATAEEAAKKVGDAAESTSTDDDVMEKYREEIKGTMTGDKMPAAIASLFRNGGGTGDIRSAGRENLSNARGEEGRVEIDNVSGSWACKEFANAKGAKTAVKDMYAKSKKVVGSQLASLKKLERSLKTGHVISNDNSKPVHSAVKMTQYIMKMMAAVNRAVVKMINAARKDLKKIIIACASKAKATVKESYEGYGYDDEIGYGDNYGGYEDNEDDYGFDDDYGYNQEQAANIWDSVDSVF